MLALIVNPFQSLIDSLPTNWTQLLDRPLAVAPITIEAIAFSLLPARMVATALEKFTQPEATEPEPYKPEPIPDYWTIATQSEPEPSPLSPLPALSPDLWPIAPKPVPVAKTQLFLPAASEVSPVQVSKPKAPKAIATPTHTVQPDGETPNLSNFFHVTGATGWFQVKTHGEGHIVHRQKKTKKHGWEKTTHLIGSHGCDCEQARKRPSTVCCHQKALKSFQLSEKTRLQKEEWERQGNEKSAKVKAELDAIASQRQQDKLNQLIRDEAQQKAVEQAKEDLGLAPHIVPKGDRTKLLIECRDLFMTCSFNASTGMEFLTERYSKARIDVLTDDELEDLADYMSANRAQLKKANLKDKPLAKSGLKEGDLCKGVKSGYNYRIKKLNNDGFAQLQTLVGNFPATLPIDLIEAI